MKNVLNYYELLGVEPNASTEEILKAHKEKIKLYHPDRNNNSAPANDLTKYINIAKDCLTDPERRKQYDEIIGVRKTPPQKEIVYVEKPVRKSGGITTGEAIGLCALGLIVGIALGSSGKK